MRHYRAAVLVITLSTFGVAQADVQFNCPVSQAALQGELSRYFAELGIAPALTTQKVDSASGRLTFALSTPESETRTLDFQMRNDFALPLESVDLPAAKGRTRRVPVASRQEIVLALLQHGRVTEFSGHACSLQAFVDHVGIRQNTVAWATTLSWTWPNGGAARWNRRYWRLGTPRPDVPLATAMNDVFLHQERYSIGCYTATKLVVVQGMLDYYHRVRPDPALARQVEAALLADGDPLVDVEPSVMWDFEPDYDHRETVRPGKLVHIQANVAADNFVPGDWVYMLNTDAVSYSKTGYEGSNAIYLGGNRFDDYYNDHRHSYTFEEKLEEVYQWRHGVFSRVRDADKIQPLSPEALARQGQTPAEDGLLLDIRVSPRSF